MLDDLLQHKGLQLRTGTAVDATLISAPKSTKNGGGERDRDDAGNVNDLNMARAQLHGDEEVASGNAGYRACTSCPRPWGRHGTWPGKRRQRNPLIEADLLAERVER
jgi:transposase, IS5 family